MSHVDRAALAALVEEAARRAASYVRRVDERPVFPGEATRAALARLRTALPEQGLAPEAVLALLDEVGSPNTVATTGGRYHGYVMGGTLPAALAANVLAAAWDQCAGLRQMSPVAETLESVAAGWLRAAFGLPEGTAVGFVSGATMANLTGLAAGRHALLSRAGWDVEARGLFGAPELEVIVGDDVHISVLKALGLLGLGRERVTRVPVDGEGRMIADELPKPSQPALVCLQAGNVNSGAFDPIAAVLARLEGSGSWVHVDGAFGLWAAASPRHAALVAGLEGVDSAAVDAHKWLNVPYDSALAFCRDEAALTEAMRLRAPYLTAQPDAPPSAREPAELTPQMSRRARGIEVWAALLSLGRSGLAELVERCCAHARRFARELEAAGFEVLNEVVLNQVLVAFGDDARTEAVIRALQEEGTTWCGGTSWRGRRAMRISVSSWATTEADVTRSLEAMVRLGRDAAR